MTKKMKAKNKISFSEAFSIVASVFLFALLMKNSRLVSIEATSALKICATLLIPSLFPLTVASELATETGAIEKITSGIKGIFSRLLGIKKTSVSPYFLGILGGYTSSCKSAVTLFENGKINEDDCEGVIAISSMPSLAFLTSFVGSEVLNNTTDGWILWGITVFSTLVLGLFNRLFNKTRQAVTVGQVQFHPIKANKKIHRSNYIDPCLFLNQNE